MQAVVSVHHHPLLGHRLRAVIAFVIPGFFDAHAHWNAPYTRYPAKSWEMQTFLAYGVTSMHKYVFVALRVLLLI